MSWPSAVVGVRLANTILLGCHVSTNTRMHHLSVFTHQVSVHWREIDMHEICEFWPPATLHCLSVECSATLL